MNADTDALDLDGPLWRYALAFYARDGVAPACLRLQDERDIDVVELIFALYAGEVLRLAVDRAMLTEARDALGSWRRDSVLPLRDIRRRLKAPRADCPDSAKEALRSEVKRAELHAEQIQLALLERWVSRRAATVVGAPIGAAATVELVVALSGGSLPATLRGAAAAIVAAVR